PPLPLPTPWLWHISRIGMNSQCKVTPVRSSRPMSAFSLVSSVGTIESIDLDAVPQSADRLDNTAAKHKLSVKPRNQRVSRKHRRLTQVNYFEPLLFWKEQVYTGNEQMDYKDAEEKRKEDQRYQIVEEQRRKEKAENHKRLEAEQRQHEFEEQQKREENLKREVEEQRMKEEEQRRLEEEEKQIREEEKRRVENEHQRIQEEEQRRLKIEEQRMQEKERRLKEEEQRIQEEKQRCLQEEEQRLQEKRRLEEEDRRIQEEEKRCHEMEKQRIQEEKQRILKEQRQHEIEEQQKREEKQHKETEEQEKSEQRRCEVQLSQRLEEKEFHLQADEKKHLAEEKARQREMEKKNTRNKRRGSANWRNCKKKKSREQWLLEEQEEEQRRGELRWKELDQRQTLSRPFSFQVSSGEKQIIFQKVNLSPVSHHREAGSSADTTDIRSSPKSSRGLPSSLYVPHTAILVTGAQLCSTAVDLNQIKDTACKSLLGFSEERRTVDLPPIENTAKSSHDTRARVSKSRSGPEQSVDQSRSATLTEWAIIRAKIMKGSDEKWLEKDRRIHSRLSDDWTGTRVSGTHSNVRKTLSANAKFSITPAWQKWADSSKFSDSENVNIYHTPEKQITPEGTEPAPICTVDIYGKESPRSDSQSIRTADATESYKFAKDLPSFLVPSLPIIQRKEDSVSQLQFSFDNQDVATLITKPDETEDKAIKSTEECTSPFGVKLRRTHYSLRFHYEQQGEQKRKKRYSAGDTLEGIPAPLTSKEKETESYIISTKQCSSSKKDNKSSNVLKDNSNSISDISQTGGTHLSSIDVAKHVKNKLATLSNEKPLSRPPMSQKPSLAPKPTQFTPPPSPQKTEFMEITDYSSVKIAFDSTGRKGDSQVETLAQSHRHEDEEPKERKCFFPSINIPWREKADKKFDSLKKEKPVLQSRHSLDSSRLVEKMESAQPLWITLAMQKQRGFREQQASKEERRQAREAKIAEKQAKENAVTFSPIENKFSINHHVSPLYSSTTQDEDKKAGSNIASKVERREHLKKSATLPNSVTVEICDSVASTPPVKDLPKRFSTPDAAPVSVEPTWLALAKRKAKAWSDCPQIIK
uniref:Capping protein inhibiting regulator of actin dynamics n=1 Tax=Callorhinchus milii TaxID=7868 RepID=A0A4W3JEY7_CALMI